MRQSRRGEDIGAIHRIGVDTSINYLSIANGNSFYVYDMFTTTLDFLIANKKGFKRGAIPFKQSSVF